jgi:hypothetical protein
MSLARFWGAETLEWITTNDPDREAWLRLMEFSNTDLACESLSAIHGPPKSGSEERNYRKQASQIRASLLQAKEYFDASRSSSAITAANPLYYGAYSLASAVMLLRGKGDRALDFLRRAPKSNSHGLGFTTSVGTAAAAAQSLNLLKLSWVQVRPTGHLRNWYETLPSVESSYGVVTIHREDGSQRTLMAEVAQSSLLSAAALVGVKENLLGLCQRLPDLVRDLRRFGAVGITSRCNVELEFTPDKARVISWRFHGAGTNEGMLEILGQFQFDYRFEELFSCGYQEDATDCLVRAVLKPPPPFVKFESPHTRLDAHGELYAFAQDNRTPEFLDAYLIAYGLSMLSRYYPDLWVSCLESHGRASTTVELVVSVLQRKLPVLTLELLLGHRLIFTPDRAPWFA